LSVRLRHRISSPELPDHGGVGPPGALAPFARKLQENAYPRQGSAISHAALPPARGIARARNLPLNSKVLRFAETLRLTEVIDERNP